MNHKYPMEDYFVTWKQEDALEVLLDYLYLMQEAANAYATELIWAFLLMIGAVSLWIWRLLGLQEAERHHLYMANSRPVFSRYLSPFQPSYFAAVYKSRLAAKDRSTSDGGGILSSSDITTSGHDELFYKYRPVPRGLWRSYDAKAENERSAPEERFLGQSNTKGGARNLGMFPSPRYHSPSLKLLGRQRSSSTARLSSIDKPKKTEHQRSPEHYRFKSSHRLQQPMNSFDDTRFVEISTESTAVVRKQDNLQDLSEQTTRLTCDQDWTVAGDRNKGIAPSDDPIHGALHTGRKILGRLEVSSDSPTKLRGFWNKVSRIPVKRYSDDQGSQVETEKAEREGEDEKIVKGEAEPIPAPDGGPSAVDKVLPHSQASRLPPVPTLVEPSAGTTASSSTPKIDAASAKDSVTDRGTSSSLGLGDLEASKSKETPKNMCCLLPDNAEEELVQRLKRKMLSSKFDRSSINSSRIKTPTPIPLARRKSWLSEPKAETSHDPLLGAKIPPYASGAAPEDEKCDVQGDQTSPSQDGAHRASKR
ncbi:uncharacterized protein LOC112573818 isoform X1 [Pomacea canaliculata]|uniref:uncharacterized protein LOC112573818 isoform X1 n=1 Tax=Pomacea canaliculata TaxID=400727 RepID=UPI000D729752|nr:uncharacterized protein LOC112573818 isoform X1 [Pomacea canaliculata]